MQLRRITLMKAGLLVVAACLSSCSSASSGSTQSSDRTSAAYLYSVDIERDSFQFRESVVQQCMIDDGFRYFPLDPLELIPDQDRVSALAVGQASSQVADEGYGMVDALFERGDSLETEAAGEREQYIFGLTEGERSEYDATLEVCRETARAEENLRRGTFYEALPSRAQELLLGIELGDTAEYSDAVESWGRCVADAGLGNFATPGEAMQSLEADLFALLFPNGIDGGEPTDAILERARSTEVQFAILERACFDGSIGGIVSSQLAELDALLDDGGHSPSGIFD